LAELAQALQDTTGEQIQIAYVDQGYTGENAREAVAQAGIHLEVVKRHEPGLRAFAVWPVIMNSEPESWQVIPGWPLLRSCSVHSFIKVNESI
jgi:transposase